MNIKTMSLQEKIDKLQPYVVQITFNDGLTVVHTVLKRGWKVPTSEFISFAKSDDVDEYYVFYTEKKDLGIDDILDYIEEIIKLNIEREKKFELLKSKTEELKNFFKKHTLSELETLRFVIGRHEILPPMMTKDFDEDDEISIHDIDESYEHEHLEKEYVPPVPIIEEKTISVENDDTIYMKTKGSNIELPPKNEKIVVEVFDEPKIVCKCGPEDICPVCIDDK